MKKIILFLSVLLPIQSFALEKPVELTPMVIEINGLQDEDLKTPYTTKKIYDKQINNDYGFKSVPDSIRFNPGVMVQQSGVQQLSPYLRSSTGYRTNLYMDGIRLNNGIWREGPNQYFGTIDPFTVGNMETTMGPGTVKYGSDALGGTLDINTRQYYGEKDGIHGKTIQRFNTADTGYTSRYETSGKQGKFRWMSGISPKWYNNITDGAGYTQPHTGMHEFDGDFKLSYDINEHHTLTTMYQSYNSINAWRVHNTVDATSFNGTQSGNLLRRSFNEERNMGYIQYHGKDLELTIADNVDVSFSVQSFNEPQWRNSDGITKSYLQSDRGMSSLTIGSFIKANKITDKFGFFEYGVETYHDNISAWNEESMPDGTTESTFGPVANGSTYQYTSTYAQNTFPLISNKLDLVSGVRFTNVNAHVGPSEDASSPNGQYDPYNKSFNFATGSGRLLWHMDDEKHIDSWIGVSQGARAPSIFDFSGDELARSYEVQTPNPNIKPEHFITYETGFKTNFRNWTASAVYYYNDIQDMITRNPTGKIIDGDYQVIAMNGGHGMNQGIELSASYAITPTISSFGAFNWQDGRMNGYAYNNPNVQGSTVPSRLTPINGLFGSRYTTLSNKWWIQSDVQMFAPQSRLSYGDKYDTTRIPSNGSPGYVLPSLRAGYNVNKNLTLNTSVTNMSNTYYRTLGSGVNAAGISGNFQIEYKF
jgi:hemoglobin/transferrin/lactoferrin receptor protein